MNIDTSTQQLADIIISSLNNNESLSVVRMGDGEMILAYNIGVRVNQFCINQIGRTINESELLHSQENIKKAILYSDIVGLPTSAHMRKHPLWESIITYYNEIKETNMEWKAKRYCSINCHLDLLNSNLLFKIFENTKKITVVSSRNIQNKLLKKFPNINEIEYYELPGEQMYETVKNSSINIFESLEDISDKLSSKNRAGELLIYGAGPFGKHLGIDFSKNGGVSLDLGSVFDLFVGKLTRGIDKGPNSYITPYL